MCLLGNYKPKSFKKDINLNKYGLHLMYLITGTLTGHSRLKQHPNTLKVVKAEATEAFYKNRRCLIKPKCT